MPLNTNVSVGQYEPGQGFHGGRRWNKASAVVITKGMLLANDTTTGPDSLKIAAINQADGSTFYYATEDAPAGTTKVSAANTGRVPMLADGTIEVGAKVIRGATNAGRVETQGAGAEGLVFGICLGRPGQDAGDQTAVAAGQLALIDWNKTR